MNREQAVRFLIFILVPSLCLRLSRCPVVIDETGTREWEQDQDQEREKDGD